MTTPISSLSQSNLSQPGLNGSTYSSQETLVFDDLERKKIPVRLGKEILWLVEADEGAAVAFRNHFMKCAKMADGKVIGMEGIHEADSLIVSLCLYRSDKDGNLTVDKEGRPDKRTLVSLFTVMGWKPKIVKVLANKARDISELNDQEDTVEIIEERIKTDTEKLGKLRTSDSTTVGEMVAKNEQPSTTATTG